MTYRIAIPTNMAFQDWADTVLQDLEVIGLSPISTSQDQWQKWATSVCQIPQLAGKNPPNPWQYQDWKQWAEQFIYTVY